MKTKIVADSTCDLSKELIEKHGIRIVPLGIIMGTTAFKDAIDVTQKDIFEFVDSGKGVCHTVAVNIDEFISVFKEELVENDALVVITISSDFSACYQNALIASGEFENVYVVDSRNLSTGFGHLVLDAAIMAEQGIPPCEIKAILDRDSSKVEASFVINTLRYLHKGGRCSAVAALGANLLQLKPCIEVKNGKMDVGKKYRGNIEKAYIQYIGERLKDRIDVDFKRIFITHTVPDRKIIKRVLDYINSISSFEEVIETAAGCTVSNHCGPYTLGILFYKK